jgi:hypothetical protein
VITTDKKILGVNGNFGNVQGSLGGGNIKIKNSSFRDEEGWTKSNGGSLNGPGINGRLEALRDSKKNSIKEPPNPLGFEDGCGGVGVDSDGSMEDIWVYDEDCNRFIKEMPAPKGPESNIKVAPLGIISSKIPGKKIAKSSSQKGKPDITKLNGLELINLRKSESKIETPHF